MSNKKLLSYLTIIIFIMLVIPFAAQAEGEAIDYSDAPASYGIASHRGLVPNASNVNGFVEWLGEGITPDAVPPALDADTFDDGVSWTPLVAGQSFDLTFIGTYGTMFDYNEFVNVEAWIDYDQNGTFETSEKVLDWFDRIYSPYYFPPTEITNAIDVPSDAMDGNTWMRVRLFWVEGGTQGIEADAQPTGEIRWGEVEDYQIDIAGVSDTNPPETYITSAPQTLSNNPNPTIDFSGSDDVTSTPDLLYATFLDGYDAGWSSFSSATTKNYAAIPDGTYTFNVKAKDEAGNVDTTPAQVTFQIDTVLPLVSIDNPTGGQIVEGVTNIRATASDDVGLDKVEFIVDGANVTTDTVAPYEYSWDSTTVTNATHTIEAKATDNAGNSKSTVINVSVLNDPTNLLKNSSFEMDEDANSIPDNWEQFHFEAGDGRSNEEAQNGAYSLKIIGNTSKYKVVRQVVSSGGSTGDSYIYGGYSKTIGASPTGGSIIVWAIFNNVDGTRTSYNYTYEKDTHDWTHKSDTATAVKDYSSVSFYIGYYKQTGTAYFDGFRLEKIQNLLNNSSFEKDDDNDNIPDNWEQFHFEAGDGRSNEETQNGAYSLKIVGNTSKYKVVRQVVSSGGSTGDSYTYGGYSKTIGASPAGGSIIVWAIFNNSDSTRTSYNYTYEKDTHDWTYKSDTATAVKDYSSVSFYIGYYKQAGTAYFDGFSLVQQ